jgi:hypothetical protein
MASDGGKRWNDGWWAEKKKEKETALPKIILVDKPKSKKKKNA